MLVKLQYLATTTSRFIQNNIYTVVAFDNDGAYFVDELGDLTHSTNVEGSDGKWSLVSVTYCEPTML